MKKEFHINVSTGDKTIVDSLSEHTPFSKQAIKKIMSKGAVWLEDKKGIHRVRRANKAAQKNNIIHCYYNEKILEEIPPQPSLLMDEGEYSVWYKPSSMLSQGSKWGDHCTINRWIEQNYHFKSNLSKNNSQRNCFIVHRLDKATSGIMLIAHSKTKTAELATLFEKRLVEKRYHAIVKGKFTLPDNGKHLLIEKAIDGKPAITIIRHADYHPHKNLSLLDVEIKTGRKHQIRIHLSEYGYPIIGDRLYGDQEHVSESHDLQLRAYLLKLLDDKQNNTKCYQLSQDKQLQL
jgi:tRNA pseudouridine32 synthase/23S rRNA pseudouridine746 synthase